MKVVSGDASTAVREVSSSNPTGLELIPEFQGWVAALQIAAVLASIGFIARFAREQLLGISQGDLTTQELSYSAGRWVIGSLLLISQWITQHSITHTLLLIAMLLPSIIALFFPSEHRFAAITRNFFALFSACTLLFILVSYEIPTTELNGWLATSLSKDLEPTTHFATQVSAASETAVSTAPSRIAHTSLFTREADDLQLTFFLSKSDNILEKCAKVPGFTLPTRLAALQVKGTPTFPQLAESARNKLRFEYAISMLLSLCVGGTLFLQPKRIATAPVDKIFDLVRFLVAYLLLPLTCLLLPYMYGKLVDSTVFPVADLQLEENKPYPSPTVPFLVGKSEHEIAVFSFDADIPHLQYWQRDKIARLGEYPDQDILQYWIENCTWAVSQAPPRNAMDEYPYRREQ